MCRQKYLCCRQKTTVTLDSWANKITEIVSSLLQTTQKPSISHQPELPILTGWFAGLLCIFLGTPGWLCWPQLPSRDGGWSEFNLGICTGPPSFFSFESFWKIMVKPSPAFGSFTSQAPNLGNAPPLAGCQHIQLSTHQYSFTSMIWKKCLATNMWTIARVAGMILARYFYKVLTSSSLPPCGRRRVLGVPAPNTEPSSPPEGCRPLRSQAGEAAPRPASRILLAWWCAGERSGLGPEPSPSLSAWVRLCGGSAPSRPTIRASPKSN
jgi:hypothetical protein